MTATIGYRQLSPCVDHQGHRFDVSAHEPQKSVCQRCGTQVDGNNTASPDPTEPGMLIPLKITEALETNHSGLKVEYLDGIYSAELRWPGGHTRQSTGTHLAMALTNMALKMVD